MPPAARATDQVLHSGPHCHAPVHPPAPSPTPVPHPPVPHMISKGAGTVMIGNMPAARTMDMVSPCMIAPICLLGPLPGGMVGKGSATVVIESMPAARMGDMVEFVQCVGPVPGPKGTIVKGEPTVQIGG